MVDPQRRNAGSWRRSLSGLALLVIASQVLIACSGGTNVQPTPTSTSSAPAATPTTAFRATTTTIDAMGGIPLADPLDPDLRVMFSIPVGNGGVTYEGGFEDWEVSGPQALAAAPDGSIWVADTSGRRLLRYSEEGLLLSTIDTDPHGVGGLIDLAAVEDGVWGLEVIPAVGRYRIVLFDNSGDFMEEHELPLGLHLEDGLSGIATTPDGRLWIELEGGITVYAAFDAFGTFSPSNEDGYEIDGVTLHPVSSGGHGTARFEIGATTVERQVREQGGITYEGAIPGWIAILVSDVAFGPAGGLSVELEVLYSDFAGGITATAAYPLEVVAAAAYVPQEFIAVGRDGRLIALKPGTNSVEVVQLSLFPVPDVSG